MLLQVSSTIHSEYTINYMSDQITRPLSGSCTTSTAGRWLQPKYLDMASRTRYDPTIPD
jgi:hypothetical protein